MEINDVRDTDAGVFVCHATNAMGEAFTSGTLNVVLDGSGVASSTLHPAGLEGLQNIQDADSKAEGKAFTLPDAKDEVEGFPKPYFTEALRETLELSEEEQKLRLECVVEPKKDPRLKVEWYHNGLPLKSGSRVETKFEFGKAELVISDVKVADRGVYTCKARNAAGEAVTFVAVAAEADESGLDVSTKHPSGEEGLKALSDAEKKVSMELGDDEEEQKVATEAPHFVEEFQNQVLSEGSSAYCEAILLPKNDPTMKIEWSLNGKALKESKNQT